MSARKVDGLILKILHNPPHFLLSINEIRDLLKEQGHEHTWDALRYALKVMENVGFVTLHYNINWKSKDDPKYLFSLNEWYARRGKLYEMLEFIDKWTTPTEGTKIGEALSLEAEYELCYGVFAAYDKLIEKLVDAGIDLGDDENESETESLGQK